MPLQGKESVRWFLYKPTTKLLFSPPHCREMSHKKVYSLCKVPFTWEIAPGISKETSPNGVIVHEEALELPHPPCATESHKVLGQEIQISLPPCPFQPSLKSAAKKGLAREDPFLAAYMECTKSFTEGTFSKVRSKKSMGHWKGKSLSKFSCKHSCGVREDGLVKMVRPSTPPGKISKAQELRTSDP